MQLPSDDMVLMWQSSAELSQMPPPPQQGGPMFRSEPAKGPLDGPSEHPSSSGSSSSGGNSRGGSKSSPAGSDTASAAEPAVQREAYNVCVWEELAHFPAYSHLVEDGPREFSGPYSADGLIFVLCVAL